MRQYFSRPDGYAGLCGHLRCAVAERVIDGAPEFMHAVRALFIADAHVSRRTTDADLSAFAARMAALSPDKDVDGFHLYNVGGLVTGNTVFSPCTPYGVIQLLESEGIEIEGQNVVVVGASNIVGKPMALMLMNRNATVAICHAKTRDLAQFTILADILIVAAGVPNLIVPQMIKTGAVVIDVGINRLPDGRIAGDVDFAGVARKASRITPVPGGVGPMTVTMLLENTILSAERALLQERTSRLGAQHRSDGAG